MAATIEDLPELPLISIFKYLNLIDIENCSLVYKKWERLIARDFYQKHFRIISKLNNEFKKELYKKGWTENCNNIELILSLWEILQPYRGGKYRRRNLVSICHICFEMRQFFSLFFASTFEKNRGLVKTLHL